MARWFLAGLLLSVGCSKPREKVSNPAVDVAHSLQQDTQKARAATDLANQAVAGESERMKEAARVLDSE